MKVLITGVHGFVGSNLVAALGDKYEIYGLDIVGPVLPGVLHTFSWDDLEAGHIPPVDAVVHLAALAHDIRNRNAADEYYKVNVGLTQKVFDWFLKSVAERFVFFSSVKAVADSVEGDPLAEDVIASPVGLYGKSKFMAEEYIRANFGIRGRNQSKKVYILRPCMIHGPGNKGNLNLLYNVVRKGIPWPLGSFENRRSFTSVDNLCFVVDRLLDGDVPSGVYHMGDDEALSTNELVALIYDSLGRKPRIWHIDRRVMTGVASLGSLLNLPLDSDRLRKLTENYVVNNAKIKAALGIRQMPVRAADGIRKTIESFQH